MKWNTVKLGDLSLVGPQYGANARAISASGKRPRYIRITDIDSKGSLLPNDSVEADILDESQFLLKDGDLLLARSGNTVGKSYRYTSKDGPCIFAGYLIRFRINPNLADSRFLFYFTQSSIYQSWVVSKRRVAGQPNINGKEYSSLPIPLPPLSEQRLIVEILDQADALRKKRSEADAKSIRILPALFYKMFGDPATNPKGWPFKPLGELSIGHPQYGANAKAINYEEGTPRYVRITDITDDGFLSDVDIKTLDSEDWEPYRLEDGDLLFARSGATVGKSYLYHPDDGPCAFAGYLIRFKLNKSLIQPWVVFALAHTPYFRSWVAARRRTAAQPNINGQEYASLKLPQPDPKTQNRFVGALQVLHSSYFKRKRARRELENLFSVMLNSAFRGDLTASWRESHIEELLTEMNVQAKELGWEENL
ncbi:MAG: hypothetical protein C4520_04830 [Candidatus Abyssobacteria bacterium SURF_5]|uniref:Type I restriction modification DNA specificity domain-containing protein n=1 Tax=Abyssobacteria bacterium (strain SURF_5) TaxID=2093360 RepID=A0A3A4NUA6_ABYX5|nr:MAG: hypothetical protein C4520_04830 [Candidatus Abyssubacteria bacterium SURF_5]